MPEYLLNLITKFEKKENDGNPLTDSPEIVPSISVAARVVQVGSSSNEQGQSKEQHTNSIHHEGKAKRARTCNDVTTVCKDDCTISSCTVEWEIFLNRNCKIASQCFNDLFHVVTITYIITHTKSHLPNVFHL